MKRISFVICMMLLLSVLNAKTNAVDGNYNSINDTLDITEPSNVSWEPLGERSFSSLNYGFILGTCSYNGDIYTLLYELCYPVLYKYSIVDKSWNKAVSLMDEIGYDASIAAGQDGVYITYTLKANNSVKVMKYANDEWTSVGNIDKIGSVPKIAVDAKNNVYVAFNDADKNNFYCLNRYKNGSWETLGDYITSDGGMWARLTLDSDGIPYVSWADFQTDNRMYVSKLIGETWMQVGDGPVSKENYITKNYQDIAVDANGNIYLAYCVNGTESLAVYRYNGDEWELLGDNVADGAVKGIDVSVDGKQNFYIAYADANCEGKVSVIKYDGMEWNYVGQRGFTESKTDSYMAMSLYNDYPYVVYTDIEMSGRASAKYCKLVDYLYPPFDVEAKVVNKDDIELTWIEPLASEPIKYNVYKNDVMFADTEQTMYVDEDLVSGIYNYAVSAVYEDGESDKTVSVMVNLTVSVTENSEVAFMMYPNPAENHITIESAKDAVVTIYSVSGQMLSQQNISEGKNIIDVSKLNAGIYFVSVNGTMVKVVKK